MTSEQVISNPVLEKLLRLIVQEGGSDLYIAPGSKVMIRCQGTLIPVGDHVLSPEAPGKLLAPLVLSEGMEILEKDRELNISVPIKGVGRFRLSAFIQRGSISAVMRFIPHQIPSLEDLHLPSVLSSLIMERRGLILMCGATGSGKSTSIAAMLQERNTKMPGHILTVEDPIEFLFRSDCSIVNQREIGTDTESIDIALKNALRQTPDCIYIGEIRDVAAMRHALAFAQSGHLCVATMHASNCEQALTRAVGFFQVDTRPRKDVLSDISQSLKAIISQRLVKTVKNERVPAVEVMINTPVMADLITKGDLGGIPEAIEKSLTSGNQTFEKCLATLVWEGKISRPEALAQADRPTNLLWRLQNETPDSIPQISAIDQLSEEDSRLLPSFSQIAID